jgi:hypothetical protein
MDEFLKKSVKYTATLVLVICAVLVIMDKWVWAGGFIIGFAWSIADMVLTFRLLRIAILKEEKSKLYAILMLKFPVLYLAGFLIVMLRVFPVWSLLLGLLPIFPVMGVVKLWSKKALTWSA